MRSRNHWKKESSCTFVAGASAAELPHLLGLQAKPRRFYNTGMGSEALDKWKWSSQFLKETPPLLLESEQTTACVQPGS